LAIDLGGVEPEGGVYLVAGFFSKWYGAWSEHGNIMFVQSIVLLSRIMGTVKLQAATHGALIQGGGVLGWQ
jgi:hypothetical protein